MDGDNFLIFNPNFNPIKPNLENSMLINPNFPAASPDSGFSSFGSRSFNDRISQLRLNNNELEKYFELNHVLGNSKLGRVSSTPLRSDSSRTQMEIRAKIASPNEGSSVSEQNIIRETEEKSPGEFISRKRKPFSKGKPPKEVVDEHDNRNSKRCKISKNKKNANDEKQNEKQDDPLKDYIHVRARRGQATDSHSLAERVRREKISERMKLLQDLVPGCNKATGKALMLDEIINYVQSLQHQVEFLSMKLATVNPLDFISDSLLSNDVNNSTCLLDSSYLFGQQKQETRQTKNDFSTHCIQLPFVDDISQEFPQLLGSYEDDLQSIVQMGFEHNLSTNPGLHSQNFPGLSDRSKMSIKL